MAREDLVPYGNYFWVSNGVFGEAENLQEGTTGVMGVKQLNLLHLLYLHSLGPGSLRYHLTHSLRRSSVSLQRCTVLYYFREKRKPAEFITSYYLLWPSLP